MSIGEGVAEFCVWSAQACVSECVCVCGVRTLDMFFLNASPSIQHDVLYGRHELREDMLGHDGEQSASQRLVNQRLPITKASTKQNRNKRNTTTTSKEQTT